MDVKGLSTKKVAGIPVVYLVALFVAILAVVAWRMKPAPELSDDGDGDGEPGSGDGTEEGVGGIAFVATPNPNYQTGDVATVAPIQVDDNDAWLKRTVAWVIQRDLAAPGAAHEAISKYLAGAQLTYAQGAIRDAAIRQFGLPPEPPVPGGTSPAPGRKQGNPPLTHTIQGPNDNTIAELSRLYYGVASNAHMDRLQASNPSMSKATPNQNLPVGTRVVIPKYSAPKYYTSTKTTNTAAEIAKKNGISTTALYALNDKMRFPVKAGTKVRVA